MRLGHYKSTTGKRRGSTNWFFMCRVTQISSTAPDKSAAVSPALIQAPAAEKKGKRAAHWPASCDAFRVQNPSGVFWGSLPHGNISSWKRQCLWCRRHLTNGSVEWVSRSGSQARGGGGCVRRRPVWEPFQHRAHFTLRASFCAAAPSHRTLWAKHTFTAPSSCQKGVLLYSHSVLRSSAGLCMLQADSVPLWKGKETLHHL